MLQGEYEFIGLTEGSLEAGHQPGCAGARASDRRVTKNSGEVTLRRPTPPTPAGPAEGAGKGSKGSSGATVVTSPAPTPPPMTPEELTCVHPPWLIEPEDLGHYIYLKVSTTRDPASILLPPVL